MHFTQATENTDCDNRIEWSLGLGCAQFEVSSKWKPCTQQLIASSTWENQAIPTRIPLYSKTKALARKWNWFLRCSISFHLLTPVYLVLSLCSYYLAGSALGIHWCYAFILEFWPQLLRGAIYFFAFFACAPSFIAVSWFEGEAQRFEWQTAVAIQEQLGKVRLVRVFEWARGASNLPRHSMSLFICRCSVLQVAISFSTPPRASSGSSAQTRASAHKLHSEPTCWARRARIGVVVLGGCCEVQGVMIHVDKSAMKSSPTQDFPMYSLPAGELLERPWIGILPISKLVHNVARQSVGTWIFSQRLGAVSRFKQVFTTFNAPRA